MSQRCLRQKPRINYYELEEPNLDEYVFCDKCSDLVFEYCSIHGPLLVIPDDKVPGKPNVPSFVPRAALTIPNVFLHLAPSSIPGAGLGMFATLTLPSGVRFGPYTGEQTNGVDSYYCWQIYDSNRKPSYCIDAVNADKSNWMRYVNCARHRSEQNLVAFQYQGQIYYRTIKIIPRFTELLVFYGSEFANELDIDLRKYNSKIYAREYGASKIKKGKANVKNPRVIQEQETHLRVADLEEFKNDTGHPKRSDAEHDNSMSEEAVDTILINDKNQEKHPRESDILKSELENCTKNYKRKVDFNVIASERIQLNENMFEETELLIHLGTHTGDKLFACNVCNMKFYEKYGLNRHMRTHTGEKPFACAMCSMKFYAKSGLNRHMRTHTGEKPFACNMCNMKFYEKYRLNMHMKTHTGEKPFTCNMCHMKFYEKYRLNRHMRTHIRE